MSGIPPPLAGSRKIYKRYAEIGNRYDYSFSEYDVGCDYRCKYGKHCIECDDGGEASVPFFENDSSSR